MDSVIPFRMLVPTADEIRPSSPLGIDLPSARETPETFRPDPHPTFDAETSAEYAAWRDALCDAANDSATEAYECEAAPETRKDGAIHHGRLPCEDIDPFNPHIIARAEVWPGEMDDVIDGAQMPAESWMGMRGGAA